MKTRLLSGLCALGALCVALFATGCREETKAERIERIARVATLGAMLEDPGAGADLLRIADTIDGVLAGDSLTDAIVARVLGELVEDGKVDRRRALIIAAVAEEIWAEFRPKDGILRLDNAKVRAAVAAFANGIRTGVRRAELIGPAPASAG